jgi:hypothetical protein
LPRYSRRHTRCWVCAGCGSRPATTPTRLAMPAIPSKPADADALPVRQPHHASADCAGDLVPWDAREGEVGPLPFDRETVAVAHTADLAADPDLAPRWLGYVALDDFKRTASPYHLHRPHLCHRRLPVGAGCRVRRRSTEDGVTGWGISTPETPIETGESIDLGSSGCNGPVLARLRSTVNPTNAGIHSAPTTEWTAIRSTRGHGPRSPSKQANGRSGCAP